MLESAQQIKKIDFDYYIVNQQGFRVTYIILCNLQNSKRKKERKKHFKTFLQAFTKNHSWISLSSKIYRTSTDYAQIEI